MGLNVVAHSLLELVEGDGAPLAPIKLGEELLKLKVCHLEAHGGQSRPELGSGDCAVVVFIKPVTHQGCCCFCCYSARVRPLATHTHLATHFQNACFTVR